MRRGIVFALGACLIWGLIFVVPAFMNGFSSIEVALGRYLIYGILSTLIFLNLRIKGSCAYPFKIWIRAIIYSLFTSIGYYTFVVLGTRFATPSICALVLGLGPITIALYGNFREKEIPYQSLIIPSILIIIGLIAVNYPHLFFSTQKTDYLLGLLFSFIALTTWSWYVVANSRFLKSHPKVHSSDWSTLMGVGTFFWDILLFLVVVTFFEDHLQKEKYLTYSLDLRNFIIGSCVLGLLCSWVGAYLWNKASSYLPVSLAGQLTIFETIFGLIFVYSINQTLPPLLEGIGIIFLLSAILLGIHQFSKREGARNSIS